MINVKHGEGKAMQKEKDDLQKNIMRLLKDKGGRAVISKLYSFDDLQEIFSFEELKRILLWQCDLFPSETTLKELEQHWVYIPKTNQWLCKLASFTYKIIEKHKLDTLFICFGNTVNIRDEKYTKDLPQYKNLICNENYTQEIQMDEKIASVICQTIQLEDSESIYVTPNEEWADLWIHFQKM